MFLGKLLIALGSAFLGYVIMVNWSSVNDKISNPIWPTLVMFLVAYVIAAIFLSVYGMGANTILQCFLVDLNISKQQGRDDASHRPKSLDSFIEEVEKAAASKNQA